MNTLTVVPRELSDLVSRLTPRQMEIVELLAQGKSNKEIAGLLSIHVDTIKAHIRRARIKVDVENRTQLIVLFAKYQVLCLCG